jgi:hypothetical protein
MHCVQAALESTCFKTVSVADHMQGCKVNVPVQAYGSNGNTTTTDMGSDACNGVDTCALLK